MYVVGGITFYTQSDSEELLIDAFTNMNRNRYITQNSISDGFDEEYYKDIAKEMYDKSKGALAYTINQENMRDQVLLYEKHWMELFNSLGFTAFIINIDCQPAYSLLKMASSDLAEYFGNKFAIINNTRILAISLSSSIVKNNSRLGLSQYMINVFKKLFTHVFVDDSNIYITYAPSYDISTVLALNRILHLYL